MKGRRGEMSVGIRFKCSDRAQTLAGQSRQRAVGSASRTDVTQKLSSWSVHTIPRPPS